MLKPFGRGRNLLLNTLRIFAVVYAIYQAYSYRFELFQDDGLQYLDMASLALSGMPGQLINSIWSPLLALLYAMALFIFRPEPLFEMPLIRALNVVIFLGMMLAFEYFLKQLVKYRNTKTPDDKSQRISDHQLKVSSYILFVVTSFCFGGVHQNSPDPLVHTFTYLCLGLLIAIKIDDTYKNHALLGLCCGLGYLSKQIFMPLSMILLFFAALFSKENRIKKSLIAVSIFLAFYLPFILALSSKLGRFTLSEAGKMSYVQVFNWDYDSHYPQGKELKHPVRKLYSNPNLYEFASEPMSTYPNFLERSYWMEGFKVRIDPVRILDILTLNSLYYCLEIFNALFISIVTALVFGRAIPISIKSSRPFWFLYCFAFSVLAGYATVTIMSLWDQARYDQGAVLVLGMTYLASLSVDKNNKKAKLAARAALIGLLMPFMLRMAWQFWIDFNALKILDKPRDWLIMQDLNSLGIRKGDRVAQLGYANGNEYLVDKNWKLLVTTGYYWARLTGVQIVADIHSTEQFNALSDEKKQEIIDILKAKNVKAIVVYRGQKPVDSEAFKWTKMPQSGSYIYIIRDKKPDLTQDREADNASFSPESRPGQEKESPSPIKD